MGKTTTVRSIMGIVRPRAGEVRFLGRPIHGLPSYRVAQTGIGLVPEGRQVFPNLSVRENLVATRSEEHTSELQSLAYLVCRLLLEKKKTINRLSIARLLRLRLDYLRLIAVTWLLIYSFDVLFCCGPTL